MNLETKMHPNLMATAIGAAFSIGAVVISAMAFFLVNAVPFETAHQRTWALFSLVSCIGLAIICVAQWFLWLRMLRVARGEEQRLISAERPSWWLHVASYPVVAVAVICLAWMAALSPVDALLLWLCITAALLAVLAQSIGATQFLRFDGPPGTLGAHIRRWVHQVNAQADAKLGDGDQQESDQEASAELTADSKTGSMN